MSEQAQCILADAATSGIVRFARLRPSGSGAEAVQTLQSNDYHTFTDALLAYVKSTDASLRGTDFAMAVGGAPTGDVIPIARSRWTISRTGLGSIFDRPATIVNDVAAAAWGMTGPRPLGMEPVGGRPLPQMTAAGRWAAVLLDDGVGTAAMDVTAAGSCMVLDAEAGHAGFSPHGEAEMALMRSHQGQRGHVSWEQVLVAAAGSAQNRPADGETWARLAGSFVGDVVFQLGAWSGVVITGRSAALLRDPRRQACFMEQLQAKNRFHRQLAALSLGLMPHRDPLAGLQAMMVARQAGRLR